MTINQQIKIRVVFLAHNDRERHSTSDNTAYTLWASSLRPLEIAYDNIVYAKTLSEIQNSYY